MNTEKQGWSKSKIILFVAAIVLILAGSFLAIINAIVLHQSKPKIQTKFSDNGSYDCLLVLGAGLREDGTPSEILQDRLQGAIELYQRGISDTLILSGDCSGEEYDEVSAMEEYCLEMGVPKEHIVRDDYGFSTYESMKNVIETMGYHNILVVTQRYHLYRAIYIAQSMGADVAGFPADYHIYGGQLFRELREIPARIKDFFLVSD